MSALGKLIKARIAASGPITVADYMADCLLHPDHGYYATRDPLGVAGDFTTAPEISQMFGEVIGLALAQAWLDRGSPTPCTLAELGPGRGTLMADILRATARVPGFHQAAQLHLIEASPTLRAVQLDRLTGQSVTHHDSASTLPDQPLFLVANEFFDALPVRQFIRDDTGWCERQVGVQGDKLVFGLSGPVPAPFLADRLADTRHGDLVEHCPAAPAILSELAGRILTHGGAALVIDYGEWGSLGDTLQALRAHDSVDPLACPGEADLTTHVDFEALSKATDLTASRVAPQGMFLERLGITERARALAVRLSGQALDNHIAAHRRLTHPDEMGTLFKVLGLTRPGDPAIPGTTA